MRGAPFVLAIAAILWPGLAFAAPVDAGVLDAGPKHPGPLPDGGENAPLPAGHPTIADDDVADEMGDPADPGADADPHAGAGGDPHGANLEGRFRAPPDREDEDPALPAGAIAIEIRDADDKPVGAETVTLGILGQSVAKGETRKHEVGATDPSGRLVFGGLETGSGVAYRVSLSKDGASFAARPFQLPLARGMRVVLHEYPVTRDVAVAKIVAQAVVYAEIKDDRIQFEEALTIYNFGKATWVPDGIVLALPPGYTALNGMQSMSDQGVDDVKGRGAGVHGTFGPGQHQVAFRFQIPYAGERNVDASIGMPPRIAAARVMVTAGEGMHLSVDGFPEAAPGADGQGNRVLTTARELKPNDAPIRAIDLHVRDLPTPGPERFVATGLSAFGVLFGLGYALRYKEKKRTPRSGRVARARALSELVALEKARGRGDVGPKTYEKARRGLVEAIARTLESDGARADETGKAGLT